ncbi:MAG: zinc chelation protein SecC [Deltaproteobacteria bacterium]|nr:zinc chelation protein SecC [Deltaproteobacteria bacterium]
MGKRVFTPRKKPRVSTENAGKVFDGLRTAKLGTAKNPARVSVGSPAREAEVRAVCEEHGWECLITVDPESPEDTSELERLLNPPRPVVIETKTGRNDACPCGSGKKYKKCCAS